MELSLYGSIGWRHPFGIGQVIEWAREYGWDSIDARGISLGVPGDVRRNQNAFGYDMLGPRQIRASARRELRDRLQDAGVPLLCIYAAAPVNLPGELGASYQELFCEYLQLAADLGARWIRSINNTRETHQGTEPMSVEEAYQRTVEGTRKVGLRAAELGVGILLENNEGTVTPDAPSLAALRRDTEDVCQVGIAYDATNAYFAETDPYEGCQTLAGKIDVLHLKNVVRHRDARWDYMPHGNYSYQWTPLNAGDLDWRELLTLAVRGGFDGPLTFEYVNPFKGMPLSYWDSLREPDQAAAEESRYLRSLVASVGM